MPKKNMRTGRKKNTGSKAQALMVTPSPNWALARGTLKNAGQTFQRRVSWASSALASASFLAIDTSDFGIALEYAALAGLYNEYRILAIKVHITTSAVNSSGYYLLATYRGVTLASSVNALWQGERPCLFEPEQTQKRVTSYEVRPSAAGEALWDSTASSSASGQPGFWGVKIYNGSGVGATVFYEAVVELRSNA
jgi:hypothetical protein